MGLRCVLSGGGVSGQPDLSITAMGLQGNNMTNQGKASSVIGE